MLAELGPNSAPIVALGTLVVVILGWLLTVIGIVSAIPTPAALFAWTVTFRCASDPACAVPRDHTRRRFVLQARGQAGNRPTLNRRTEAVGDEATLIGKPDPRWWKAGRRALSGGSPGSILSERRSIEVFPNSVVRLERHLVLAGPRRVSDDLRIFADSVRHDGQAGRQSGRLPGACQPGLQVGVDDRFVRQPDLTASKGRLWIDGRLVGIGPVDAESRAYSPKVIFCCSVDSTYVFGGGSRRVFSSPSAALRAASSSIITPSVTATSAGSSGRSQVTFSKEVGRAPDQHVPARRQPGASDTCARSSPSYGAEHTCG